MALEGRASVSGMTCEASQRNCVIRSKELVSHENNNHFGVNEVRCEYTNLQNKKNSSVYLVLIMSEEIQEHGRLHNMYANPGADLHLRYDESD
uniref:Uncharacterized protein n=1 Tax=Physcomitrium patens TaxID=3218 RepID=A0A2K1ICM9_PHYPA|nr:hypothetical protein PHYPA_030497 [Physcomitrium patens]